VTIQVQPTDNGLALLNAIKGAKKSVHMEMYLLSSDEIITALVALKNAGKDVKVVLNQNFPPNGGSNTASYNTLKNNNVNVVWAPQGYNYTHAKTIIIDGTKLIVMTMNLTYTSAQSNREYIATDTDPTDVADAEKIFDADFKNVNVTLPTTRLVLSPDNASAVDAQTRLVNLIGSAKTSLDVEVQSLSDDTLVDAIVKAHKANVTVRVVLDGDTLGGTAQEDAVTTLKSNGVPVKAVSTPDIHAKAIVVDGARAFVGSQNMTPTALFANREMGIITDATAEVAKVKKAIGDDFAKGTVP
jgi:cardiolipin synthase